MTDPFKEYRTNMKAISSALSFNTDPLQEYRDNMKAISSLHSLNINNILKVYTKYRIDENNVINDVKDKSLIKQTYESLVAIDPIYKELSTSYQKGDHYKTLLFIVYFIYQTFLFYNTFQIFLTSDIHYKVNSNNINVRATPTTNDKDNIIIKLNKNVYVEKIDSSDNGWLKVKFEYEDGEERLGWIYRTKLTRID